MLDWSTQIYCLGPCGKELRRIGSENDGRPVHQGYQKCVKCRGEELRRSRGIPQKKVVWFDETHQECTWCNRKRPLEKFPPKDKALSGRNSICQTCFHLRYTYKITFDTYLSMSNTQAGKCEICVRQEELVDDLPLHVDHNHATGEIRALLCGDCNRGLGLLRESIEAIYAAINYLLQPALVLIDEPFVEPSRLVVDSTRFCISCRDFRDFSKFGGEKNGQICRRCRHLKGRYGILYYQLQRIKESQANRCAICSIESSNFHVDHDHSCCKGDTKGCGKCIRGLLCGPCNHAIGLLKEDSIILMKMIEYIRKYN